MTTRFAISLLLLLVANPLWAVDELIPEAASGRVALKSATSSVDMAVTANPHATEAATQMLALGGSAVDAAIAAQLVLGLVEPQSSGLGGGAFLLHWNQSLGRLQYYDGRETAPKALTPEHLLNPETGDKQSFFDAVIGGHSVGTPGVVALMAKVHWEHGKLPWPVLFEPAIRLAKDGFAISPRLHTMLVRMPRVAVNPAIQSYFFEREGDGFVPKPVGMVLRNPAYADTLELLAKNGASAFYEGPLAKRIVSAVRNDPNRSGLLSLTDLSEYRALEREPVCGALPLGKKQYTVCGAAPPSSGGSTVIAILGALAAKPLPDMDEPLRAHRFSTASRLAFADRNHYVGDPDQVWVPLEAMTASEYLEQRGLSIEDAARQAVAPGEFAERHSALSPELPSTSHLSIVDAEGNIVSMTTSIETGFGSRVMVGGFLLNNQLTDFAFQPKDAEGKRVANAPAPGKRPRSSMSPTIVFEGQKPVLVIGSPGGARIINYVARVIWDTLAYQQPLDAAVAAPHMVDIGSKVELEPGAPEHWDAVLEAKGHPVVRRAQTSGLSAIEIRYEQGPVYTGVADPRREGTAASSK